MSERAPAGTDGRVLGAVRDALAAMEGVHAALLFGSHARGNARSDSDVDVGVLLARAPEPHERTGRVRELIEALGRTLPADRVDLVLLNDAPPKLAFRVLAEGRVALDRDPVALHRFRVRTYDVHADREPVERFFREVTRRRAMEGSPG